MLFTSCGTDSEETTTTALPSPTLDTPLRVVASNGIVADWVSNVGGDRVNVVALVPVGSDPHTFQPGARDVTHLANADVIFTIGLGLETSWMTTLIENASVDTSHIVELGSIVNPLLSPGDDDNAFDPHFWMDPLRVKTAVSKITSQLGSQDTTHVSTYKANQTSYTQELEDLHLWSQEQLRDIPVARKVLITSHDNLRYFAQRYRFDVIGTIIQGTNTERGPTPSELANLEDIITAQKVNAIFSETTISPQLTEMIAQETGAKVFELYSGSLGPKGSNADTYLGMMRADVSTVAEALK